MKKYILHACSIALVLLLAASCSEEEVKPQSDTQKNAVGNIR
jgi:hypothetical protein